MNSPTRLEDYLDLEWFLEKDRTLDLRTIQSRDRALGLEAQRQSLILKQYFKFWLRNRRSQASSPLPSSVWCGAKNIFLWVILLAGLGAGFSLVRGLLQYFGLYPVNVSVFLLVAVFSQLLLSILATMLLVVRCLVRKKRSLPGLAFLVLHLTRLGSRLMPQAGFVRSVLTNGRYTPFLVWEVMKLLQIGGISLALGTLAGLLGSVAVTDLAFGWQSTLASGSDGMDLVVAILSWPWSWLPTSWGLVPSLEQIEGSRIVLKEGLAGLASTNLVAWWPFLSLCLFFYGLIPRCLLYFVSQKNLSHLEKTFVHPDLSRIVDRMQAPLLDQPGLGESPSTPLPVKHGVESALEQNKNFAQTSDSLGCVLILPPELKGCLHESDLETLTRQASGYPLGAVVAVELETERLHQVLSQYQGRDWIGGHERYAFLIEAWQPPIQETLTALAHWGSEQSSVRSLFLILVGRPQSGQWLVRPSALEEQIWRKALDRLAPLRVGILPIPTMEGS